MKRYNITVNGTSYEVEVEELGEGVSAAPVAAPAAAPAPKAAPAAPKAAPAPKAQGTAGSVKVNAPMPGNILKINVTVGQKVNKGDVLCILEAMKMENEIMAPDAGTVSSVNVTKGATVNAGDILVTLA